MSTNTNCMNLLPFLNLPLGKFFSGRGHCNKLNLSLGFLNGALDLLTEGKEYFSTGCLETKSLLVVFLVGKEGQFSVECPFLSVLATLVEKTLETPAFRPLGLSD